MSCHSDEAYKITNPRLLCAVYFALLAVIATIVIDLVLYLMGVTQIIPVFKAVILAVIIAGSFGALFGKRIIYCKKPFRRKAFILGFLMVLAALPFYDLGFLYMLKDEPSASLQTSSFEYLVTMYLFILFYSFILAGLWIALCAGFAAMYLLTHLIYDILHTDNEDKKGSGRKRVIKPKTLKPDSVKVHH